MVKNILSLISFQRLAFIFVFLAFSSVQVSYMLNGLAWLDYGLWLIVPAFILFIADLFLFVQSRLYSYGVMFFVMLAGITYGMYYKTQFIFGIMDDNYHNAKIIAACMDNAFFSKWRYLLPIEDMRFYLPDFLESLWGLSWRWTRSDLVIIVAQALPLLLLWRMLTNYFERRGVRRAPALLATVVVLSLQPFWSQIGSTYIDSTAGVIGAVTLLLLDEVLLFRGKRPLQLLAGLAFTAGICLVIKASVLLIGLTGLVTALWFSLRQPVRWKKFLVIGVAAPALVYLIYHQTGVWILKGDPFYPLGIHQANQGFDGYYYYYYHASFLNEWIRSYGGALKLFYILGGWVSDCNGCRTITPDTWSKGNGLLFVYFVIPVFSCVLFWGIRNFTKAFSAPGSFRISPHIILPALVFFQYWIFDGSPGERFMLAYNTLILAWCLACVWRYLEQRESRRFGLILGVMNVIVLVMAAASYWQTLPGVVIARHNDKSMLKAQYLAFPDYIDTMKVRTDVLESSAGDLFPRAGY